MKIKRTTYLIAAEIIIAFAAVPLLLTKTKEKEEHSFAPASVFIDGKVEHIRFAGSEALDLSEIEARKHYFRGRGERINSIIIESDPEADQVEIRSTHLSRSTVTPEFDNGTLTLTIAANPDYDQSGSALYPKVRIILPDSGRTLSSIETAVPVSRQIEMRNLCIDRLTVCQSSGEIELDSCRFSTLTLLGNPLYKHNDISMDNSTVRTLYIGPEVSYVGITEAESSRIDNVAWPLNTVTEVLPCLELEELTCPCHILAAPDIHVATRSISSAVSLETDTPAPASDKPINTSEK